MLFGHKDTFAIECDITKVTYNFIFGRLRIWLDECSLGRFSEEVLTLEATTGELVYSLKKLEEKVDSDISNTQPKDLLFRTRDVVYEGKGHDPVTAMRLSPLAWLWGCEGFEYTRSIRLGTPHGQKIAWQEGDDGEVHEATIPNDMFVQVINDFLRWFTQSTGYAGWADAK